MTYFEWLTLIVCPEESERESYQKLFKILFEYEFIPIVKNDDNRAIDGTQMRIHYEDEIGKSCEIFGGCRVLEMLVALACRCENTIMHDPDEGDRTYIWFWEMIRNMGLISDDDWDFNEEAVTAGIERLNNRTYEKDGFGGPFYIAGFRKDMRKIELWYQLNHWLNSQFMW